MKTLDFILSEPLNYHSEGKTVESSLLELTAPAGSNRRKVARLKQGFMRCIGDISESDKQKAKEIEEKKKGDGNKKPKPSEILAALQMGSIDYADYIDIFIGLLTSGICKVEGKVPVTELMLDKISYEDLERLLGEYFVNFIYGSLGE